MLVVTCFLVQYLSNMIQYFINTAIKVCSLLCYTTWSDSTIGIKLWKYKSPGALCCKVSSLRHLDRRKEVRSFRWSRKTWSVDNFKFLSNNVSISVRKNFGHSCLVNNKKTSVSFDTFQVSFLFKNCFNHQHRLARVGQNYSHLDLHGGFPSIITLPDLVDETSENDRQRHYQILFCLQIHLNKAWD